MPEFLTAAAILVLITVAAGLIRIVLGPTRTDRLMAAQLLGTGGIAVLLLLAAATRTDAIADVVLILALLAAFAAAAFARGAAPPDLDRQ
jgi:multicomponent Na+:H+ antiporter subunit F